jgi:hypothetical protein
MHKGLSSISAVTERKKKNRNPKRQGQRGLGKPGIELPGNSVSQGNES